MLQSVILIQFQLVLCKILVPFNFSQRLPEQFLISQSGQKEAARGYEQVLQIHRQPIVQFLIFPKIGADLLFDVFCVQKHSSPLGQNAWPQNRSRFDRFSEWRPKNIRA